MEQPTRPVPHTELAGEIRAELARQRKKLNDLAQHLGMSPATLYRRLSDPPPKHFRLDELDAIAHYLGLTVPELIQRAIDATEAAA
jgi:DNA-binding Xre family transcriptional regulator